MSVLSSPNFSIRLIKSYINYMAFLFFHIIAFSCTVHLSYICICFVNNVFTCVYLCICMCLCIGICVSMCVYTCVYLCVCIYVYMCICIYVCMCIQCKYIKTNSFNIVIQQNNYRSTTWAVQFIKII